MRRKLCLMIFILLKAVSKADIHAQVLLLINGFDALRIVLIKSENRNMKFRYSINLFQILSSVKHYENTNS